MKDVNVPRNNFDLLSTPLLEANLIEASAGTGKTYAITGLFLRLLVERNLSLKEILIVTFTEAATQELKYRIRTRLRQAIKVFSGERSDDIFLNDLAQRNKDSSSVPGILKEALRGFDQAAIFTIHGFCRQMLQRHAFESGSLFDTELITDLHNLQKEIGEDFWRRHFYRASPLFVRYAMDNKFSTAGLLSILGGRVAQPYLKVIPAAEIPDTSVQEEEFTCVLNKVRENWQTAGPEVEKILASYEGLNRVKYRRDRVIKWVRAMDEFAASTSLNVMLFNGFEKFTASELKISVKQDKSPPYHNFFELCEILLQKKDQLETVFERRLLGLKAELFHYAEEELKRRKKEKNIQSFDDLLLNMKAALKGEGGEGLGKAIRGEFKAALIDEFQDTDPVQYEIFKQVFGGRDSILFLIGDPKQAIYGFRGADVFTYMDAAGDVKSQYTLGINWRSEPGLIDAVNTIFSRANLPFVYEKISFQPVAPAVKEHPEVLRINGKHEPSLQMWFVNEDEETESGKTINKGRARDLIKRAVASEISRILTLGREGLFKLGDRPLAQEDIAVLVRTNADAKLIQEALSGIFVPSVLFSTGSLFDSHEAVEMERLLKGIIEPNNEKSVKAALATDIIGIRGEDFDSREEDESGWEKWPGRLNMYHDLWNERGFIRMFRQFMMQENVLERLMSLPDGERRNTNLLHLAEVLHRTSIDRKLGMTGLLKWFYEQMHADMQPSEEHQLRLESDENAVKIVTIHKSKGLEYPVVFCPFSWEGSNTRTSKEPFTFHDEADNMALTLDLGSEQRNTNLMAYEKELLAENLRLLYVALTRAKNLCYLVWGCFKDAESSALSYLLHKPDACKQEESPATAAGLRFKGPANEDALSELQDIACMAGGEIGLTKMPVGRAEKFSFLKEDKAKLSCREFSRVIDRGWRISSYSSLTSGLAHFDEMPDRDAVSPTDIAENRRENKSVFEEKMLDIFSFPKGAKAGTFLHDVLERMDFSSVDPMKTKDLVTDRLREYGYQQIWQEAVCRMLEDVVSAPLDSRMESFSLSCIGYEARLNELEFYFPIKKTTPEKLKSIFIECAGLNPVGDFLTNIGRLDFEPVTGFMKGFIDLVFKWHNRFYIVDWKSNFFGERPEHYNQAALKEAMSREFYVLQYHLYTLALDQYLRVRMPGYRYEENFGGVFYIFLRGVHPETSPDLGVYSDLPAPELIGSLRRELIEGI